MLTSIRSSLARVRQRAAAERAYRRLQDQSDHLLRDMGLTRDGLNAAVRHGRVR